MKPVKLYLLSFWLVASASVVAQSSSVLNLSAPDSCAFLLRIDDRPANAMFASSITLHGLESGKHTLAVQFMNPQLQSITSPVTLKPGLRHNFYVQPGTLGIKVIAIDESPVRIVQYNPADTTISLSSAPRYTGLTGCESPLEDAEFDNLMGDVHEAAFQTAKLGLLLSIVEKNCLEVDQLHEAIGLLDLEEHRLQVVERSQGRIFDIERSAVLEDAFFLESSKQKLRKLFQR